MILIGQYDSPFARRVGIALHLYGVGFEHRPWSTFGDAEALARFNPLRRVPTLVLDDGEVLVESGAILDHLDATASAGRPLIAAAGPERRRALKVCALATGLADKAVGLFYSRTFHGETSPSWTARCRTQIGGVIDALEDDRQESGVYWFGDLIGHADIAVACALRFLTEAPAGLFDPRRSPKLAEHAARCENLDAFRAISQPFIPPSA